MGDREPRVERLESGRIRIDYGPVWLTCDKGEAEQLRAGLEQVLGTHDEAKADSPLWTNPASRDEPYAHLEVPDNLDEVVARVAEESREHIAERVRPYEAGLQRAPREKPSPRVGPPTLTREELAELREALAEALPTWMRDGGRIPALLAMAERCVELEHREAMRSSVPDWELEGTRRKPREARTAHAKTREVLRELVSLVTSIYENCDRCARYASRAPVRAAVQRLKGSDTEVNNDVHHRPSPHTNEPRTLTREELAELDDPVTPEQLAEGRRRWDAVKHRVLSDDRAGTGTPEFRRWQSWLCNDGYLPQNAGRLLAMAERCADAEAERGRLKDRLQQVCERCAFGDDAYHEPVFGLEVHEPMDPRLSPEPCPVNRIEVIRRQASLAEQVAREEGRDALRKYGRHADDCRISMPANNYEIASGFGKCTCGLSAARGGE